MNLFTDTQDDTMTSLSFLVAQAIDEQNQGYLAQPKPEQHIFAAQSKEDKKEAEAPEDDLIEFLDLE